jgi:Ca-activated chloride channel family protein
VIAPAWLGLEWLRPELLLLALLAAPCAALGALAVQRSARALRSAFAPALLPRVAAERSAARAVVRTVLGAACLACAALALGGPVLGHLERPVTRRGVDLVVCLDTSRSMLARDVRPTRLERAKREILGLFEAAPGDRFALLAFSGDTRQVAPLSDDRGALTELLARVSVEDNRLGGTDLGAALERALDLFDGRTGASEAILLLTDGEDLNGQGLAVAARAAERGIRVYVVGIGTRQGGKIPTVGPDGVERFLVGPDGREVETRLEDSSLRTLAESTGGAYLSTEQSPTPLETLYSERVRELDRREAETGLERVPQDRYQWPLALAVLLGLCEAGLRDRRPLRRTDTGGLP